MLKLPMMKRYEKNLQRLEHYQIIRRHCGIMMILHEGSWELRLQPVALGPRRMLSRDYNKL